MNAEPTFSNLPGGGKWYPYIALRWADCNVSVFPGVLGAPLRGDAVRKEHAVEPFEEDEEEQVEQHVAPQRPGPPVQERLEHFYEQLQECTRRLYDSFSSDLAAKAIDNAKLEFDRAFQAVGDDFSAIPIKAAAQVRTLANSALLSLE